MAKITLKRAYILAGKPYGPGVVENVPDDVAKRLQAREQKLDAKAAQVTPEPAADADGNPVEAPPQPARRSESGTSRRGG